METEYSYLKQERYEEPFEDSYEVAVTLKLPLVNVTAGKPEDAYEYAMDALSKQCKGLDSLYRDFNIEDETIDIDGRSLFADYCLDVEINFEEKSERQRLEDAKNN